jgi:hypothetical protein
MQLNLIVLTVWCYFDWKYIGTYNTFINVVLLFNKKLKDIIITLEIFEIKKKITVEEKCLSVNYLYTWSEKYFSWISYLSYGLNFKTNHIG